MDNPKDKSSQARTHMMADDIAGVELLADGLEDGNSGIFDHLSNHLLALSHELKQDNALYVRDWLDTMNEQCFRRSATYQLAKRLYFLRHSINGGSAPEELLQGVIDRYITDEAASVGPDPHADFRAKMKTLAESLAAVITDDRLPKDAYSHLMGAVVHIDNDCGLEGSDDHVMKLANLEPEIAEVQK